MSRRHFSLARMHNRRSNFAASVDGSVNVTLDLMPHQVVPLREQHFADLHAALDRVAREKQFLVFQTAPPIDEAYAFYRNVLANDSAHFVALVDNVVAGWCDVLPTRGESRAHVGILG